MPHQKEEYVFEAGINFSDIDPIARGKRSGLARAVIACRREDREACKKTLGFVVCSMHHKEFTKYNKDPSDLLVILNSTLKADTIDAEAQSIEVLPISRKQPESFEPIGDKEEDIFPPGAIYAF